MKETSQLNAVCDLGSNPGWGGVGGKKEAREGGDGERNVFVGRKQT